MIRARGFTLLELVLVVVNVGLITAIAIPRITAARERSQIADLRTSLRNFAVAEESYFYDYAVYTADEAALRARGLQPIGDVEVLVNEATNAGWSATVSLSGTLVRCSLFVGGAAPIGSAVREGTIGCS